MKKLIMSLLVVGYTCHAQVSIQLLTPLGQILKDEEPDIRVVVSNATISVLQVLEDTDDAYKTQLFFVVSPQERMDVFIHENALVQPNTNYWADIITNKKGNTSILASGQAHIWEFMEISQRLEHFSRICLRGDGQVDMYVQVLVGTNLWFSSNTNTVQFSEQEIQDGILRFTGTRPWKNGMFYPFQIYEHMIDGNRFLFCKNTCSRICQVPEQAVPSFEVEAGTDILKITFSDNSPQIRYKINERKVVP